MPDCFDARLHMSGEQQTTKLKVPAAQRGILIQAGGGSGGGEHSYSSPSQEAEPQEGTRSQMSARNNRKMNQKMWATL